jgi:hypothetical protein
MCQFIPEIFNETVFKELIKRHVAGKLNLENATKRHPKEWFNQMRQGAEANANSYKVKNCIIEQLGEGYTHVVEKMS